MTLDRLGYLHDLQTAKQNREPQFEPLPHQEPPEGDWFFWLLEAGRGAGKTAAAAHWIKNHLNGPPCISESLPHRALLIAPTIGDGIESANLNDQALTRIEPGAVLRQSGGGSRVEWPNGSQIRIVGTHSRDDIERLRAAGNTCVVWCEELAAWRYLAEAWELMMFGLRIGESPRVIATTTPKARPPYVKLREQADHISHATTLDNPNLNAAQKQRLQDLYEGTSIGQQELYGQLLEEADGALWTTPMIEVDRIGKVPVLGRVVVGVDPPGGATEAGIVTAGLIPACKCGAKKMPHFAVLDDTSGKLTPERWGAQAVASYEEWEASRILGEANYGGDMVESIIRQTNPDVSYKPVHASRGKKLRAEPIMALYEQHRVHHVGSFPELEAEMVQWEPDVSDWSPNRLDALVWVITELSGGRGRPTWGGSMDPDLSKPRGL